MVVIFSTKQLEVIDLRDVRCFWIIDAVEEKRIEFSYSGRKVADTFLTLPADVDDARLIEILARAKNEPHALEWERIIDSFKRRKEEEG